MTLRELFENYQKQIEHKKIIICHWSTQEGFEINNIEEFQETINYFKNNEVYLINGIENDTMSFFEYFVMNRVNPYVVVLRHPLLTNAYWKDLPDKIIDSFVSNENNVYRYLMCDYGKGLKDYVIEFSPNIDVDILQFCTDKMKKGFLTKSKKENSSISLIFTNSSRFEDFDAGNFVTYELSSIYDQNVKTITTLNLSKKFFNGIKKIGKNND